MTPETKEAYLNELKGKSRFFRAFECTYSFYFANLSKENEEEESSYQERCRVKLEKEEKEKNGAGNENASEANEKKGEEIGKGDQSPVNSSRTHLEDLVGFKI